MKKSYQTPVAEKIEFAYRDQVVVASGIYWETSCHKVSGMNYIGCVEATRVEGHDL